MAITVIIAHSGTFFGFKFVGSTGAVELFFIISGFYMTMILNKKYVGKGSYRLFFTNRLLRLYPIYFAVLSLTFIISIIFGIIYNNWLKLQPFIEYYNLYDMKTLLFLLMTNIVIFGQDLVMFLGIDSNGGLFFTSNFNNTDPVLAKFLLIPPAWSIALELTFYLLAPLLLRRKPLIIILFILISLLIRVIIYFYLGWMNDPWTYRFFPLELALFLFGSLAFRFYENLDEHSRFQYPIIVLFFIIIISFQYFPSMNYYGVNFKNWILYLFSIIAIPYLFKVTKNNKLDSYIGELSYPIYVVHWLIVGFIVRVTDFLNINNYKSVFPIIISTLMAMLLVKFIDKPMEKIRQMRVKKKMLDIEN